MRKKIDPLVYAVALFCVLLGLLIWRSTSTSNNRKCGEDLTWHFDRTTGELRISGTGEMGGWFQRNNFQPPWEKHARKIKTVSLPEGLTSICFGAFGGCEGLTKATVYGGVSYLFMAFSNCTALKTVVLSAGINEITCAFSGCTALEEVTIPDTVKKIGWSAFSGCSSLRHIVIPKSVTEIDSGAFEDCVSLTELELPAEVKCDSTAFLNTPVAAQLQQQEL